MRKVLLLCTAAVENTNHISANIVNDRHSLNIHNPFAQEVFLEYDVNGLGAGYLGAQLMDAEGNPAGLPASHYTFGGGLAYAPAGLYFAGFWANGLIMSPAPTGGKSLAGLYQDGFDNRPDLLGVGAWAPCSGATNCSKSGYQMSYNLLDQLQDNTGGGVAQTISVNHDGTLDFGNKGTTFGAFVNSPSYQTSTICASTTGDCHAAAAGSVSVAAGANPSVIVFTSAVTANSSILLTFDSSLASVLGSCNTNFMNGYISNRTLGAFTLTVAGTFTGDPACFSYLVVN